MTDTDPLRVCLVSPGTTLHRVGGMQQQAEDLARGLLAAGHRVTLLTARVAEGDLRALEGLGDVEWEQADADPPRHDRSARSTGWLAASLAAYRRVVAATGPFDVIHSQSGGARAMIDAGEPLLTPTVMAYHGNFYGFVRSQMKAGWTAANRPAGIARGIKRSFKNARHHYGEGHHRAYRELESIVVSASQLRDTVRSQRLDPTRTHVVLNGIDVHTFTPGTSPDLRAAWGVPDDAVVLMTLGRLAADKGNDRAVRALAQLPGAVLVIVGGGEAQEPLRRLVDELGVGERVVFTGPVPQVDVPRTLRAADVFVFPTVRDEGAPLVMPQAMAAGLPVVASRSGGTPDYVAHDGVEAILVPPGDVPALVAALGPLIADPGARRAMGAAARERAVADYSLEAMTAGSVAVYRAAIAHHVAQRRGATAA